MVSLFVLSTLEGWPDYMYNLIDGGKEETGPILNNYGYVLPVCGDIIFK